MPGIRHQDEPIAVPPKSKKPTKRRVSFADPLVTFISRPITNDEHWALWDFEVHAMRCLSCCDPYRTHKSGRTLCNRGHWLAQQVAEMLYKTRDGQTYSIVRDKDQDVQVEIPPGFRRTMWLLMAIERAVRHRQHFVSLDRTYYIPPRVRRPDQPIKPEYTPTNFNYAPRQPEYVPTKRERSPRLDSGSYPEIDDWPRPERRPRYTEPAYTSSDDEYRHGPLYIHDLIRLRARRQRERAQHIPYKLETREPFEPFRYSRHRHRSRTYWD